MYLYPIIMQTQRSAQTLLVLHIYYELAGHAGYVGAYPAYPVDPPLSTAMRARCPVLRDEKKAMSDFGR